MRRAIVPAFALFGLLVAAACGSPAVSSPAGSVPAASVPAASEPAATTGSTACHVTTDPVVNAVEASIADRAFDPDPVEAKVGGAISWHNEDAVPHTATLDDVDCDTDLIIRGATGTLVFDEAGTYAYHCRIHPTMHGTITITP